MNSTYLIRKAGFCGLSGVIAALGFAGVAYAAPAGGGQQATTSRPDVVSAAITDQPSVTNAAGIPKVKVCFDQQIGAPLVAANFALTGADVAGAGNPLPAASVAPIPTELSCVSLSFAAGVNAAGFSNVEVKAGAVATAGGGAGTNPQGAAALTGSNVAPGTGRTSGPNLTKASVAVVAGGTEVTFEFDKLIAQGAPILAANFGYYNAAGVRIPATSFVSAADRSVKVMFADLTVPATARVFALNDAVKLASQPDQGNVATATSGSGGPPPPTATPDLVTVTKVASLQGTYDLVYDQNITSTAIFAANCVADTPSTQFTGTAVAVTNATTVRVTFGGLATGNRADEEIVRISDAGGCALENTLMTASSVGGVALQNKDHSPGFTSGPDLTGCSAPAGGTDVTYTFDELLTIGAAPGTAFGLIDADAGRTDGTVLQVVDNRATIRFAAAGVLFSAVACTVDRGAITDRQPGVAEPSSLNTVKANSTGTPENAPPAVPIPNPTPNPVPPIGGGPGGVNPNPNPGPATPFVRRTPRSLSISISCKRRSGAKVRCVVKGTLRPAASLLPLGLRNICTGKVRVRFKSGSRTISSTQATLSRSCKYTRTKTFSRSRTRGGIKVQGRYGGNAVSKAKNSRTVKAKIR